MLVKKNGKICKWSMYPHIGIFQTSCLIRCKEYGDAIDIRYFPHCRHLETYCMETDGLPVYLENNGNSVIYFTANVGVIELEPGEESFCQKKMQRSFWFERHEYDGQG